MQLCNITNIRILHYLFRAKYGLNSSISRKLDISTQLTSKRLKKLVAVGLVGFKWVAKNKLFYAKLERFTELGLIVDLLIQQLVTTETR